MTTEQAVVLLERMLYRMTLINGFEDHCVHEDAGLCENHRLMREVQEALRTHSARL